MIIDAHVHLWSLSRAECRWPTAAEGVIFRDHLVADLKHAIAGHGIQSVVLVQSQECEADTEWLLEIASAEPLVAAVVGWADLRRPDATERVVALATQSKLVGLRPMVQDRPANWFDDPSLDTGLVLMADRGVTLDALVRVAHLPALDRLAARHPDLRIVIDHAAKPAIAEAAGFEEWRSAIAPLSAQPNVCCKISGLLTERGDCPPEAVVPYVEELLALFGPDRMMWGSDWPVLNASGDYAAWLELAKSTVPERSHEQLFARTVQEFYSLQLEDAA